MEDKQHFDPDTVSIFAKPFKSIWSFSVTMLMDRINISTFNPMKHYLLIEKSIT